MLLRRKKGEFFCLLKELSECVLSSFILLALNGAMYVCMVSDNCRWTTLFFVLFCFDLAKL